MTFQNHNCSKVKDINLVVVEHKKSETHQTSGVATGVAFTDSLEPLGVGDQGGALSPSQTGASCFHQLFVQLLFDGPKSAGCLSAGEQRSAIRWDGLMGSQEALAMERS